MRTFPCPGCDTLITVERNSAVGNDLTGGGLTVSQYDIARCPKCKWFTDNQMDISHRIARHLFIAKSIALPFSFVIIKNGIRRLSARMANSEARALLIYSIFRNKGYAVMIRDSKGVEYRVDYQGKLGRRP